MRGSSGFLGRHALVIGIALMFLFTWPIDLANAGLMPFQVPFLLYLFLGWGFILAAVLMTWLVLGRAAVGQLLRRYLKWRVVAEILRVRKPGGTLLIADFVAPTHAILGHIASVLASSQMMQDRVDQCNAMLVQAGFADVGSGSTSSRFLAFVRAPKPVR